MLRIIGKEIDLEQSPILYSEPVSAAMLGRDWTIRSGEWWVNGDWINGRNPHNNPGMIVSNGDFRGNVLVDFEARTVPLATSPGDVARAGSDQSLIKETTKVRRILGRSPLPGAGGFVYDRAIKRNVKFVRKRRETKC